MKREYKTKSKKRRKQSLILLIFFFILLLFILIGTGTIAWSLFHNSADDKPIESVEVKDLTIENTGEKDVRTVKNTATEEHHKTNGLAICMYHYVYDENDPPEKVDNNYIEISALEEELQYLIDNNYYFPTWEEVRQYVDGELLLPEKSVVITFDDGSPRFLKKGAAIIDKYKIPITSFLITTNDGENKVAKYESDYITFQSHSHNMHRGGGNIGHGGIFPVTPHDEALADLQESIRICKNGEAFAYPYGDYNDACVNVVAEAGFLCAVTTEYGRVYPGDNPLLLPRMRMTRGQSLDQFIEMIE